MSAPDFKELEQGLRIDRMALSDEATHYPMMFYHASRGLALAESEMQTLRKKQEEVESALGRNASDELGKVTVAVRNDYIKDQPKWQRARQRYLDAKRRHAEWQALVDAWRQKSFQLRVLADMMIHELESDNIGAGTKQVRRAIRGASTRRRDSG